MPDPLQTNKMKKDIGNSQEDEVHNTIVAKALSRRKKKRRYNKVAMACGVAMLKNAIEMPGMGTGADPMPQPLDMPKPPATGPAGAMGGPMADAAGGAPEQGMWDKIQSGAGDLYDKGKGMAGDAWKGWGDMVGQDNNLMKYGIPGGGAALLAYMLYRKMRGGGQEKQNYDKLAEYNNEGIAFDGKVQYGAEYGTEGLPSGSKQVSVTVDTNNGWGNHKFKKNPKVDAADKVDTNVESPSLKKLGEYDALRKFAGCSGRKKKGEGYHKAMMVKDGTAK